jgi:hypothetical protein
VSAARAIARAEAAGVRLLLRPDGGVRMEAAAPPPADVLGELRRWRDDVARLLAARERQPECGPMPPAEHDAAEAAAMAARPAAPLPDLWLTRVAVTLAALITGGGAARLCPDGSVDAWATDGRYHGLSARTVARLRAARLLPPGLRHE